MRDPLPLPDDLTALWRAADEAHAKTVAYGHAADAELRDMYADEEPKIEHRFLTPEQSDTLARLRSEEAAIRARIRSHPTMVEALATGCYWSTDMALREAAAKAPAAG